MRDRRNVIEIEGEREREREGGREREREEKTSQNTFTSELNDRTLIISTCDIFCTVKQAHTCRHTPNSQTHTHTHTHTHPPYPQHTPMHQPCLCNGHLSFVLSSAAIAGISAAELPGTPGLFRLGSQPALRDIIFSTC
jgi:hypothetical protein